MKKIPVSVFAALAACVCAAQETRQVLLPVSEFRNLSVRGPRPGESTGGVLGFFVKAKGRERLLHVPLAADTCVSRNTDKEQSAGTLQARDNWFWCVLMKPDLSALEGVAAEDVEEAWLSFRVGWMEKPNGAAKFEAHRMLTDWEETAVWAAPKPGATWKNGALARGVDLDAEPLSTLDIAEVKAGGVEMAGFAQLVRGWVSGAAPNCGILLRLTGGVTQVNIVSREAGGQLQDKANLRLRGDADAVFKPNNEVIATLLIAPDDLRGGELRFRNSGANTLDKAAVIEVFPLRVDAAALRSREPRPGADFGAVAGSFKIADLPQDKVVKIPVSPEAMKAAGENGFLVRVANAGDGELVAGSDGAGGVNAPQFFAGLRAYPNEDLFTQPVRPRPGVYTGVKNGHLEYGGERLRLWGVAMRSRNPELATRLRRLGFNAARMWGPPVANDFYDKECLTGLPAENKPGSGSDTFHRAFAEMAKVGIFIDFTALMDSVPVSTADESWLKAEGPADDWDAWREAWNTKDLSAVVKTFGASFDPRLMAARKRHIQNILTFKNPYTGRTYAEEECVALFELNNEQEHARRILEKGFDTWPEYFRLKYQRQWNDWLRKKYPGGVAWELPGGESLAENTVALEPVLNKRGQYPAARANDFIEFVLESIIGHYKELEAFARTFGPAVAAAPFSYDTQYKPSTHWLHTVASGDVANFGMYFWGMTSTLSAPPSMYVMDSHTVKGKPTVIYETNVCRPNPTRAEGPFRVAALATHQDWDAVFWHYYMGVNLFPDVPDEQYLALPQQYMTPSFYWTAVEFEKDPVIQSAISVAGQIFLRGLLPPAKSPVVYTIPRDSLYSYETFNGVNTTRATFEQGAVFDLQPGLPGKTSIAGADPEVLKQRLETAVASNEHIIWDWPNSRLLIDAPAVKAYVGRPSGFYRFKDGITLDTHAAADENAFITIALVSSDNAPLLDTKAPVYLTAVSDAQNTGFKMNMDISRPNGIHIAPDLQAKNITNHGRAPLVWTPAPFQLLWPKDWTGGAATYDFAFRKTGESKLAANLLQRDAAPPWLTLLHISANGAPRQTPATTLAPQFAAAPASQASQASQSSQPSQTSKLYNPLPQLSWDDSYYAAHKILRDGALIITSISPEDTSQKPDKTLTLFNAEALPDTAADIEVAFAQNRMSRITLTFTRPLPLTAMLARLEKELGPAAQKNIVETGDKTSTVIWPKKNGLAAELKEAQGVQTVVFQKE